MKRLLWWLAGVPVGIVLVALAVANRKPISVSFDPFRPEAPAFAVSVPLFVAFFAVLMAGVLIGGIAAWASQGRHRKGERRWRQEADRLRYEREQDVERQRASRRAAAAALPAPERRAA